MVIQRVDVGFNGVMLVAQRTKAAAALTLLFALVALAPLGHDDFRNVKLQQLPVFLATGSFIKIQARDITRSIAASQPVGHANGFLGIRALSAGPATGATPKIWRRSV
jgi:hypothetical protein